MPADGSRHVVAGGPPPAWWSQIEVPVGLVFFLRSGDGPLVASYPGAAGVIEAEQPVTGVPESLLPVPDTEALVVLASGRPLRRMAGAGDHRLRHSPAASAATPSWATRWPWSTTCAADLLS